MRNTSFSKMISWAGATAPKLAAAAAPVVATTAVKVQARAMNKIGHYQPAVGPFNAWQTLAPVTLAQKQRAGAAGDDPLIGYYPAGSANEVWPVALRASIEIAQHTPLVAEVGTNDPIGPWQEFGTSRGIPPRPFMRPSGYEEAQDFKRAMEAVILAVAAGL